MIMNFKELVGKIFSAVERSDSYSDGNDAIIFTEKDTGKQYALYHSQDCCESVGIEDVVGELSDLVDTPIIIANESYNLGESSYGDSATWSFYNIATIKGHVTIRFFGESNGYYSETADLYGPN